MSDSLIIRGNIRENFSVLPNDLMNDERLSADALGVLVYLLSKPTDWQVRVTELRRRFDIGRDKVYRILESSSTRITRLLDFKLTAVVF